MANRKVIWLEKANFDFFDILKFYNDRNKSKIYSKKLYKDIKFKLKNLDFSVTFPQKTAVENLYYLTHNHISIFFSIEDNDIIVKVVTDERRSPELINYLLINLD
jgi:toxin YoeB